MLLYRIRSTLRARLLWSLIALLLLILGDSNGA